MFVVAVVLVAATVVVQSGKHSRTMDKRWLAGYLSHQCCSWDGCAQKRTPLLFDPVKWLRKDLVKIILEKNITVIIGRKDT